MFLNVNGFAYYEVHVYVCFKDYSAFLGKMYMICFLFLGFLKAISVPSGSSSWTSLPRSRQHRPSPPFASVRRASPLGGAGLVDTSCGLHLSAEPRDRALLGRARSLEVLFRKPPEGKCGWIGIVLGVVVWDLHPLE